MRQTAKGLLVLFIRFNSKVWYRLQVLAASETECEEEREGGVGGPGVTRRAGGLGSLAGADDALYLEHRRSANAQKHPLFKKFRY